MKKVVVAFIASLLMVSSSFAISSPELQNELHEKLSIELGDIELNAEDYVLVNFNIVDGRVKIENISSTKSALRNLIIIELMKLSIESSYDTEETYTYMFTFEKI